MKVLVPFNYCKQPTKTYRVNNQLMLHVTLPSTLYVTEGEN